jgi:hypothetical protein
MLRFAAVSASAVVLATAGRASANPMDLAPERLVTCNQSSSVPCGGWSADGQTGNYYQPDNAAWAKLVSQYAMAIAPSMYHPARTTGWSGYEFTLYGAATTISKDQDFMKRGTEGPLTNGLFSSTNPTPDPVLQVYGIMGRKGLPYGFELQGSVGYLANTSLATLGGGIRWSLYEGFRGGAPGFIPDISVGGYVNTLAGSSKVKITVPSFEVQISKPFTIANIFTISPIAGFQYLWIDGDSGVIDTTPAIDGLGSGAAGSSTNTGCNARPPTKSEQQAGDTGEYHCQTPTGASGGKPTYTDAGAGSTNNLGKLDLNNNVVFQNVRFTRQRVMFGLSMKYEVIAVGLYFLADVNKPESGGDARIAGLDSQFTFGANIGTSW